MKAVKVQALLTAKSLAQMDLSVKAIYTSPLQRAVETAKNIATIFGLDVIARNELIEFDYGQWEGRSVDEVKKSFPKCTLIG